MGQLDSTCRAPPGGSDLSDGSAAGSFAQGVAAQVAFERQTLKPVFFT
jgi:hypothetical protein